MTRLTELTPEQVALMPVVRDEWIEIGLACGPADLDACVPALRRCYEAAGLSWHGRVVRSTSPLVAALAGPIATRLAGRPGSVSDSVRASVYDSVLDSVDASVRASVRASVSASVRASVRASVYDSVLDSVLDSVDASMSASVSDLVRGSVGDSVYDSVEASVEASVRQSLWRHYIGGNLWAAWCAYIDYYRQAGHPLPGDLWDRWQAYTTIARNASWWWPHRDFTLVTDRPEYIHLEATGQWTRRLHRADGPSIAWSDGWMLHHWHGLEVPADLVTGDGWDLPRIMAEPNAELRRCAVERLGWDTFTERADLTPVHTAPDPGNPGQALRLYDLPEKLQVYGEPVRLLIAVNGSPERDGTRRTFGITVPADLDNAVTAAAWTYDTDPDTYTQLARRT